MNTRTLSLILAGCLILGCVPREGWGQDAGTRTPVPHEQAISANPFLLLFEWFNVEYERKVSDTGTLGFTASGFSFDEGDETYRGFSAFYRYYPQGAALSGFSLGGRLGYPGIDEAIAQYQTLLLAHKASPELYVRLAGCYHRKEDTNGAKEYLRRALELDPNYAPALRALQALDQ